ncbi:MAG: peptidylprolyl isomerase, partial [Lentisphaerae bacterium]|nr:peptidylprolyl isomerase [Lentisphaerota bacterium]
TVHFSNAQLQQRKQELLHGIVESFVRQTLLMKEARRLNIFPTEEEEQAELQKLADSLPNGMTIKEAMKSSGMNQSEILATIRTRLMIDKLLIMRLKNKAMVSDAELNAYCEQNKEQLHLPERVRASHILITNSPDNSADAEKRAKIDDIRKQLLAGADFAELAKQYSDCPSSANGGDLGTFGKGQMVEQFERAAFSQEIGEIGPVIKTQFGYHIIKVLEKNAAGIMPRDKVAEQLIREKTQKAILDYITQLKSASNVKYGSI